MTKLNKREKRALTIIKEIISAVEEDKPYELAYADRTAIKDVFGIDLMKITTPKKNIKSFYRGKSGFYNGYFPF